MCAVAVAIAPHWGENKQSCGLGLLGNDWHVIIDPDSFFCWKAHVTLRCYSQPIYQRHSNSF